LDTDNIIINDGGPGSGNYGHAGRPGQVGGSSAGSSKAIAASASSEKPGSEKADTKKAKPKKKKMTQNQKDSMAAAIAAGAFTAVYLGAMIYAVKADVAADKGFNEYYNNFYGDRFGGAWNNSSSQQPPPPPPPKAAKEFKLTPDNTSEATEVATEALKKYKAEKRDNGKLSPKQIKNINDITASMKPQIAALKKDPKANQANLAHLEGVLRMMEGMAK
jgi:hypothetical protein